MCISETLRRHLWKAVVHPKQFHIDYRTNVGNYAISTKSYFRTFIIQINLTYFNNTFYKSIFSTSLLFNFRHLFYNIYEIVWGCTSAFHSHLPRKRLETVGGAIL